jgi:hypothetical protein
MGRENNRGKHGRQNDNGNGKEKQIIWWRNKGNRRPEKR